MNLKMTLGLVAIAAVIGGVVYVNPFAGEEEKALRSPWFFQVEIDDIKHIEVSFEGESVKFDKTPEGTWAFDVPATLGEPNPIVVRVMIRDGCSVSSRALARAARRAR